MTYTYLSTLFLALLQIPLRMHPPLVSVWSERITTRSHTMQFPTQVALSITTLFTIRRVSIRIDSLRSLLTTFFLYHAGDFAYPHVIVCLSLFPLDACCCPLAIYTRHGVFPGLLVTHYMRESQPRWRCQSQLCSPFGR
jgi:hypothetical protein